MFNEQSKQLHQIFKDGSVYNITHLKPQVIKDSRYKRGTSNCNLIAQTKTSAFLEDDDSQIPFKTVNTTKFSSLEEKMGDKVNILGIVTDYTDPITIGDYIKKEITMCDMQYQVKVTLWNELTNVDVKKGQIVIIEDTSIKSYKGFINCSGGSINLQPNSSTKQLEEWWTHDSSTKLPFLEQKVIIKHYEK